jgi:hypothetical protein
MNMNSFVSSSSSICVSFTFVVDFIFKIQFSYTTNCICVLSTIDKISYIIQFYPRMRLHTCKAKFINNFFLKITFHNIKI